MFQRANSIIMGIFECTYSMIKERLDASFQAYTQRECLQSMTNNKTSPSNILSDKTSYLWCSKAPSIDCQTQFQCTDICTSILCEHTHIASLRSSFGVLGVRERCRLIIGIESSTDHSVIAAAECTIASCSIAIGLRSWWSSFC